MDSIVKGTKELLLGTLQPFCHHKNCYGKLLGTLTLWPHTITCVSNHTLTSFNYLNTNSVPGVWYDHKHIWLYNSI